LVKDRERRNLELYATGKEVLERYEAFGLGRAIVAREPFTGLAKVKLEEQIQGYQNKLLDGFVKEGDPVRVEEVEPAATAENGTAPTAEVGPANP